MYYNLFCLENLSNFRFESISVTSNKNTKGVFHLLAKGFLRIIYFSNIKVKKDYETIFKLPDWFCDNARSMIGSCTNGSGGANGETAEISFNSSNKSIHFYPNFFVNYSGDLELTGQLITIAD